MTSGNRHDAQERRAAVTRVHRGEAPAAVAKAYGVRPETLRRWALRCEKEGKPGGETEAPQVTLPQAHAEENTTEYDEGDAEESYEEESADGADRTEERARRRSRFADSTMEDCELARKLLRRRLMLAQTRESVIERLIRTVMEAEAEELSSEDKKRIVRELRGVVLDDPGELARVMSVLYDKAALAAGDKPTGGKGKAEGHEIRFEDV